MSSANPATAKPALFDKDVEASVVADDGVDEAGNRVKPSDVDGANSELRRYTCCRDGLVGAVPSPKTAPGGHHAKICSGQVRSRSTIQSRWMRR